MAETVQKKHVLSTTVQVQFWYVERNPSGSTFCVGVTTRIAAFSMVTSGHTLQIQLYDGYRRYHACVSKVKQFHNVCIGCTSTLETPVEITSLTRLRWRLRKHVIFARYGCLTFRTKMVPLDKFFLQIIWTIVLFSVYSQQVSSSQIGSNSTTVYFRWVKPSGRSECGLEGIWGCEQ